MGCKSAIVQDSWRKIGYPGSGWVYECIVLVRSNYPYHVPSSAELPCIRRTYELGNCITAEEVWNVTYAEPYILYYGMARYALLNLGSEIVLYMYHTN